MHQTLSRFVLSLVGISLVPAIVFAQDNASLKKQVADFEAKYSVEIVLKGHAFDDEVQGADSDRVDQYLPLILEEFGVYPANVLSKAGVSKIVLCKDLAWEKQKRGAVPGFGSGIMFYDCERASYDPPYLRSIIHHEFFHQIDWRDDGKVYVDKQWARLNAADFSYGKGGAAVQGDSTQGVTFDKPGFMNKYSTQGVEEDKAEIFAYLMTKSELMKSRKKKDPIVSAKIKMMKTLVLSFSPNLDESFWKAAAKVDRAPVNRGPPPATSTRERLNAHADALSGLFDAKLPAEFLKATKFLPKVKPFQLYFDRKLSSRQRLKTAGLTKEAWLLLDEKERQGFTPMEIDDERYYFHRYGSPLSFVRVLDLVGRASKSDSKPFDSIAGKKVVDFGFGSITTSRIMASCGAKVISIDVDPFLASLYSAGMDTGVIPHYLKSEKAENSVNWHAANVDEAADGQLEMLIGKFPVEKELTAKVGEGIDLFVSKNTLKRGFIHPAQTVDAARMIELGVGDQAFVKTVYDRLNNGGYFMIFNLHPKRTAPGKGYQTWSDGRCPFDRGVLEKVGFTVIEYDKDDTAMAHSMGKAMGFDRLIDLDKQFRATYTLLRK
ncbi:MAG: hypothetical protein AB8B55_19090 [Mariniblastus sp.]